MIHRGRVRFFRINSCCLRNSSCCCCCWFWCCKCSSNCSSCCCRKSVAMVSLLCGGQTEYPCCWKQWSWRWTREPSLRDLAMGASWRPSSEGTSTFSTGIPNGCWRHANVSSVGDDMSGRRCRLVTDDDKDLDPSRDELRSEGVQVYGCHPERAAE